MERKQAVQELRGELLFIKGILDGYALARKSPKYLTDEVEMYGDRYGDVTFSDTRERINDLLK